MDISALNPYEDPAFAAYMRGEGVNEANLRAEVAVRQNRLATQQQAAQPVFAEQLSNGLRNIGNSYEGSGNFNSGRRVSDQTEFSGDVARQQTGFNQDIANQQSDLSRGMASQIAGLQQGAAEAGLNAQVGTAIQGAQVGLW